MEEILYKSEGMPSKRKKALKVCAVLEIICGGLLIAISRMLYGDCKKFFLLLGICAAGIGCVIYFVNANSSANKSKLYLYENHIEGVQVSPYSEFKVKYSEIADVQKVTLFANPMIQLKCGKGVYTILTDDLDKAYSIICDKVYGEV